MKKYFLGLLALVGFSTLVAFAPGKEKGFEGKISYSLTYNDLPPEMEAYSSMLPKEMVMYIKGEKSRIEQNTGMGSTIVITDNAKKHGYMIMDMMGMKNAFEITSADFDEVKKTDEKAPQVTYSEETKDIAGYKCKKAIVKREGEEEELEVYYTEEIPGAVAKDHSYLKGFPMEYTVNNNGMSITMSVASISKEKVSDKYFEVPEGYEVKPYSEMMNMFGGAGKE